MINVTELDTSAHLHQGISCQEAKTRNKNTVCLYVCVLNTAITLSELISRILLSNNRPICTLLPGSITMIPPGVNTKPGLFINPAVSGLGNCWGPCII